MEKRIDLERRGKDPDKVEDLNLDNCRTTQIEGLNDSYTSLESLSMINVGLTSLKNFPKLESLKKVELSDNRISTGLTLLQGCPNITHLNISGNKIKDLDVLEPLKTFEHLTHLDLYNNPISNEEEDYRQKVFKLIPSLKYLDGTDVNEEEEEDSDDEEANAGANGVVGDEEDDDEDEEGVDDEDDGEEGEEEESEDDEEEEGPGLAAIYGDLGQVNDEEDGDFDGEEEEEEEGDDEIDEEEESEAPPPGGKRRKMDDGGGDEGDGDA